MSGAKRSWTGFASGVEVNNDGEEDGQRASLTVTLTSEGTPLQHVSREIQVVLTKPMIEAIARVGEETGALYFVYIEDPAAAILAAVLQDRKERENASDP
jgi:hypothetical protein